MSINRRSKHQVVFQSRSIDRFAFAAKEVKQKVLIGTLFSIILKMTRFSWQSTWLAFIRRVASECGGKALQLIMHFRFVLKQRQKATNELRDWDVNEVDNLETWCRGGEKVIVVWVKTIKCLRLVLQLTNSRNQLSKTQLFSSDQSVAAH